MKVPSPTPPVPNTPGRSKFIALGAGAAIGVGAAVGLERALVEPERALELEQDGESMLDSRQASILAITVPFGLAAGIALGLQKRSPTAGATTTTQIAAAAMLSSITGLAINSGTDRADASVLGVGGMLAAAGVGILAGVRDEVRLGRTRMAGLGLFGIAAGAAAPIIVRKLADMPGEVSRGFEHRER